MMKKVFHRAMAFSCSLLLALLIVEVSLRSFAPLHYCSYIGACEYDDELGTKLKSSIHFLNLTDYQQEVRTNDIGTVNFQESFDAYETLVFAIGDSFTQGTGLPSDASYPFQLDLQLNMPGPTYEKKYGVVNLGLAAYGLEQEILSLKKYSQLIGQPKYVLWLGCQNDHADDKKFLRGDRHRHLVEGSPHWGVFVKPLQAVRHKTEIGKHFRMPGASPVRKQNDGGSNRRAVAQHLEPSLCRLADQCNELGATLLMSFAQSPEEGDGSYEWLRTWAKERDEAHFVDWHESAKSVTSAIPNLPIRNPHSGGHYRTWLNHVIATAFREEILAHEKAATR